MRSLLTRSLLAATLMFLLAAPLSGVVLSGYDFHMQWQRPLWLALAVFFLRMTLGLGEKWPRVLKIFFPLQHLLAQKLSTVKLWISPKGMGIVGGGLVAVGLALPFFLNKYWLSVAILALIYVLLALGLNIVVGLAGMLDLGFVAFYAVGAYSFALGQAYLGMGFWLALPFGAILAAGFGVVLGFPVLRMHGDYLAIVTLGFGEIIRLVLNNWTEFTGGPNGLGVGFPTLFGLEFTRRPMYGGTPIHEFLGTNYSSALRYIFLYLILFLVVLLVTFFLTRLKRIPLGRSWEALREDEIACRSLGINHVTVKLSAFAMGAMVGGIGGVFFAASQGFVNPTSFTFFESALILAIVVLGGLGSIPGVIMAAIILTVLPEVLRDLTDIRILIFGLAMVLMMTWRPMGLVRPLRPVFLGKGKR